MDKPILEHRDSRPEQRWENEGGAQEPKETLRQLAMEAIGQTRFVPAKGRNRIGSMVEGRPDWVLSRQRAWGVPITLFVNRATGEYLVDAAVNARIVAAVREGSVDVMLNQKPSPVGLSKVIRPGVCEITRTLLSWIVPVAGKVTILTPAKPSPSIASEIDW